jgi:hypothetical protein
MQTQKTWEMNMIQMDCCKEMFPETKQKTKTQTSREQKDNDKEHNNTNQNKQHRK